MHLGAPFGFGGTGDEVIAYGRTGSVRIAATDTGILSSGCGTWSNKQAIRARTGSRRLGHVVRLRMNTK
jgi:hypothetical protein